MIPENFWQLQSRKMAGEASPLELDELAALLRQHPELKQLVSIWDNNPSAAETETNIEAQAALAALQVQMQLSGRLEKGVSQRTTSRFFGSKRKKTISLVLAAACLVLAVGSLLLSDNRTTKPQVSSNNQIVTDKGAGSKVLLPDSTEVWLNAQSRLTYPPDFNNGPLREVYLSGEAFFEVAKDGERPFIIHTDKINIKVLGTAFNLKSYPNDDKVETALIHGKIEVTILDRPAEKIVLHPNEKLTVHKNQFQTNNKEETVIPKIQLNTVNFLRDSLLEETAWLHNKMIFSDESFEAIAKVLERKFDVTFHFNDQDVKNFNYTAVFENENLSKILEVMSLSQNFSYSIRGQQVIISK